MNRKVAVVILLLSVSSVIGQTPSELEKKYGKPITVYLVSESIWMTPEYTTDGQLCMMRLHPQRFGPDTNNISPTLPFQELTRVLNQLVPPRTRGAKTEPFNTGAAGAGVEWMSYAYENVEFSFVSSFRPNPDSWKTRKEYVFSVKTDPAPAQPKSNDAAPSDDDFFPSQVSIIEIVNIKWKGRQCAKP